MIKSLFAMKPAPKPFITTQQGWANMYLPISSGLKVNLVAATNEVLRHCRIGKVAFKAKAD